MNATVTATAPYKLASREGKEQTFVSLAGENMGDNKVLVIAGPCAVESKEQILEIAHSVKNSGATALRGGAFKPRTSPYSFQGVGEIGLKWLAQAREETGLAIVTEVLDQDMIDITCDYADVLQIGSRNMQNFALLTAAAKSYKPILIKRGMANTIEELIFAAEYVLKQGNDQVMICERGIRTFSTHTRNTFDINAIPVLKSLTHLPVIADPSHATGKVEFVEPAAKAAIAAGADGLLLEVHPKPAQALSDGRQSLSFNQFHKLTRKLRRVAQAVDRDL
jgi:3-deoxy-7-phosphoheptulonate synthase